jgi:hypothetical protein
MQPIQAKSDNVKYLLGGAASMGTLHTGVPVMLSLPSSAMRVGVVLFLLLVNGLVWWALRYFTILGDRVVSVCAILLGAYWLWNLMMILNMLSAFRNF